ncbi:MAG: PEP-CTERM sorting domain-containing protein [Microcystis sp.]
MIIHKNLLSVVLLGLGFFSPSIVSASTITQDGKYSISGVSSQLVTSYTGTGDSVFVDSGNGPVPTGPLSFTLDTTKTNVVYFNFDSGYATINAHILLDAPILHILGESPASINIIESAFLPSFNIVETSTSPNSSEYPFIADGFVSQPLLPTQTTTFVGGVTLGAPPEGKYLSIKLTDPLKPIDFIGGGIVETGTFAGFQYWNKNRVPPEEIIPAIIDIITIIINEPPEPNPPPTYPPNSPPPEAPEAPAFNPFPTLPRPVLVVKVPEPTSTLSILALGTLGAASTLKRKLKPSQSTEKETTKVG